jgi:hypothetical protein
MRLPSISARSAVFCLDSLAFGRLSGGFQDLLRIMGRFCPDGVPLGLDERIPLGTGMHARRHAVRPHPQGCSCQAALSLSGWSAGRRG